MFLKIFPFRDASYYDDYYDESMKLLYLPRYFHGTDVQYEFDGKLAHPPLDSLEYAHLLLDRNGLEDITRAIDIIQTVLSLQCMDEGEHRGLFPQYVEMVAVQKHYTFPHNFEFPIAFFEILNYYEKKLPANLVQRMLKACYNQALLSVEGKTSYATPCSTVKLWEVYTLFRCGKIFNAPDFINCAISSLNAFCSGTTFNGNIWEYNSFYETYAASEILMMIKRDIPDELCRSIADTVYDILWKAIAKNFHAGVQILSGPQADVSRVIPCEVFLTFIACATGIKLDNTIKNHKTKILSKCPDKYLPYFKNENINRFNQDIISRGNTYRYFVKSRIASNYMQSDFAIGSFNHESFWGSHENFIGYFKSDNVCEPYTIKLDVLNNGHDFSSAELHSVQFKETVIGNIIFSTNFGDIHPDLTPIDGKFLTSDFRIRFSISGDVSKLSVKKNKNAICVRFKNTTVRFKYSYINIDGFKTKIVLNQEKDALYFDIVVVESDEAVEINLLEMEKAICLFAFNISSDDKPLDECDYRFDNGFMISKIKCDENELMLKTPYKPDYREYTNIFDEQYINNICIEEYLTINQVKSEQYEYIATSGFDIKSIMFTDNILSEELGYFKSLTFDTLKTQTKAFFDNLNKSELTLDAYKRYSIFALKAIFEFAKNHNYKFEHVIDNSYFDIFQNITLCSSYNEVREMIVDVAVNLQNMYSTFNSQQKKMSTTNMVIDIIAKNYQNPDLSLSMVSEMLGISESYITRIFKKSANTTYVKYVIRIRMEKAKELLLQGYTQEETIKHCGYLNISSFKRSFKNYSGMTVSEWLRENK